MQSTKSVPESVASAILESLVFMHAAALESCVFPQALKGPTKSTRYLEAEGYAAAHGASGGLHEIKSVAVASQHRHIALRQKIPQID
jgi:hypothetical protein